MIALSFLVGATLAQQFGVAVLGPAIALTLIVVRLVEMAENHSARAFHELAESEGIPLGSGL